MVGAFVMPNAPIPAGTPLASFAVPLEALEQVAGLIFFPRQLLGAGTPRHFPALRAPARCAPGGADLAGVQR